MSETAGGLLGVTAATATSPMITFATRTSTAWGGSAKLARLTSAILEAKANDLRQYAIVGLTDADSWLVANRPKLAKVQEHHLALAMLSLHALKL